MRAKKGDDIREVISSPKTKSVSGRRMETL
jgi:hypothetical protein